jgi:hypothetical protein
MSPRPFSKSRKSGSDAGTSVISQWFSQSAIEGLERILWFHELRRFGKTAKATESLEVHSRNDVAVLAFRHFLAKYKLDSPNYHSAPDEGKGLNASLRVPTDVYVAIKMIAQRDRQKIEHTVETAIHAFLADVQTKAMLIYHRRVVKRGLELLKKSERRRRE